MVDGVRESLVRAGVELVDETGDSMVGLREVARRAGVSHGAPRHWFPTHKALLAAIAHSGVDDLAADLRDAAAAEADTRHALAAIGEAYVAFARRRVALFALMFRHDLLEGSGENLRAASLPLLDWLTELIGAATGGSDAHVRRRALRFWTSVHGVAALAATRALDVADADSMTGNLILDAADLAVSVP